MAEKGPGNLFRARMVNLSAGEPFDRGENRNNSRDGRTTGFVALGAVIGDVRYRYFPAPTWTRFGVVTE
jgi:hypothetical protein